VNAHRGRRLSVDEAVIQKSEAALDNVRHDFPVPVDVLHPISDFDTRYCPRPFVVRPSSQKKDADARAFHASASRRNARTPSSNARTKSGPHAAHEQTRAEGWRDTVQQQVHAGVEQAGACARAWRWQRSIRIWSRAAARKKQRGRGKDREGACVIAGGDGEAQHIHALCRGIDRRGRGIRRSLRSERATWSTKEYACQRSCVCVGVCVSSERTHLGPPGCTSFQRRRSVVVSCCAPRAKLNAACLAPGSRSRRTSPRSPQPRSRLHRLGTPRDVGRHRRTHARDHRGDRVEGGGRERRRCGRVGRQTLVRLRIDGAQAR
jgi:hypothetical protein